MSGLGLDWPPLELFGGWIRDPEWLLLLLLLPLGLWLRRRRGQRLLVVPFASAWAPREVRPRSPWAQRLALLGLCLLAIAVARPQHIDERDEAEREGYDLILALDLSPSMLAEDGERNGRRINRLQMMKPILEAFLARRVSDRIGLVAFAGRAYTVAPLSFDHDWLARQIARLDVNLVEDGTAIGDALAVALARLDQKERKQAGKRLGGFVILLTDGANNAGQVAPLEAAEVAAARGIPIYTIGTGRDGPVPMPMKLADGRTFYRNVVMDLDEETLAEIARSTGGRYFRAEDAGTVEDAFAAIDEARKIDFDARSNVRTTERFAGFAGAGLLALLAAFALTGIADRRGDDASREGAS